MVNKPRKASWKLTFGVWSSVMLVWAILTVALNHDLLLVLKRLSDDNGSHVTWAVALLIGLPVLLDAARNMPRYRRRWRARGSGLMAWQPQVPATTPRRFETEHKLTRREQAVVEQGQLAFGRVERHGAMASVRYDPPWGQPVSSMPLEVLEPPTAGAMASLLFEPGSAVGLAPSLRALKFLRAPPEDLRLAEVPVSTADSLPAPSVRSTQSPRCCKVLATLHPVERFHGSRDAEVGELTCNNQRLTLTMGEREPCTIRLDRPVVVTLSVHLLSDDLLELCVRLSPRRQSAYRNPERHTLCFKTELRQRQVGRAVERRWTDAVYLSPRDFTALWPAIQSAGCDHSVAALVAL